MILMDRKLSVGVMGGAEAALPSEEKNSLIELTERLGKAIAEHGCILVTGGTTGLPFMVSRAARMNGGLTIGISPAVDMREHTERFHLPLDGVDVLVYTGFGLKGRNVINIRSSDIVIIIGGGIGTLNEFTIAYDEAKVIGVLTGSGGVADHILEIIKLARKPTSSKVVYSDSPETLLHQCIAAFEKIEQL